jgi:diguanylate cyclase (GGDEF)-like protein
VAEQPFDRAGLELLGALADQAAVAIENARLFQQVNVLSKTDPLTGLANRRQLEHDLAREFAAAVRGRKLYAVMFDLNDFKDYNDRYGHLAGDEALRLFGEVLAIETRTMNFSARYGGDEFCALLADTDEEGARIFSLRVKRHYARRAVTLGRRPIGVSAGFAQFVPEMKRPEDLLAAADQALYRSKAKRFRAS